MRLVLWLWEGQSFLPEALMDPQSNEAGFGIIEVWVSSEQTLKYLESVEQI